MPLRSNGGISSQDTKMEVGEGALDVTFCGALAGPAEMDGGLNVYHNFLLHAIKLMLIIYEVLCTLR